MRLRLLAGTLALGTLAGVAACGHVTASGIRSGHPAPAGQALPRACQANSALARLGVHAAAHTAAMGWVHFKIAESGRHVRFTQSGAGLGFGHDMIAGRALFRGLAGGWPHSMRLVLLNGRFHLNAPGMQNASGGKPWIASSADSVSTPGMAAMRELPQHTGFLRDPRRRTGIYGLLGCSKRVSGARKDRLDGEAMTRYAGLLPFGSATAGDPTLTRMQAQGARSVSWALWVDNSGLPRRLVLAAGTSTYGHVTMDERFSGWGKPVRIKAPPSGKTATVNPGNTQGPGGETTAA
ncbi:MAG: hypothetical protein ACM3ML_16455 [Micromonosporaceae bacterium]